METTGRVLDGAWFYDLTAWLWSGGKEREFRERLISLAGPDPGATVLDIGCGTGTLAIAIKKRVGAAGNVIGVDASSKMIERARSKTRRAGTQVTFECAVAESLPFPDGQFDLVFSTLMLHHLPAKARKQCLAEARRVLKTGGRAFIADFETSGDGSKGLLGLIHRRRHGHVERKKMPSLLAEAGLMMVGGGLVGYGDVHYSIAVADLV